MAAMRDKAVVLCSAMLLLLVGAMAQPECYVTKRKPAVPKVSIDFCRSSFPDKACCVGGFDNVISQVYDSLLGDFPGCDTVGQDAKNALQRLFCIGCDPDQPRYTIYNSTGEVRVRVCSWFAEQLDLKQFDACGLTLTFTRGNECSEDDTVIASEYWGKGMDGIVAFINDDAGGKPPLFESKDRTVVFEVVDDEPCYGDSAFTTARYSMGVALLALVASTFLTHWLSL